MIGTLSRLTLMTLCLGSFAGQASESKEIYRIFYIPIDVQLYAPIPEKEFEQKAFSQFDLKSDRVDKLFSLENQKTSLDLQSMDSLRIKIKRKSDGKFLYITSDKVVTDTKKRIVISVDVIDKALSELDTQSKKYPSRLGKFK